MFCPQCGTQCADDARFCKNCGSAIKAHPASANQQGGMPAGSPQPQATPIPYPTPYVPAVATQKPKKRLSAGILALIIIAAVLVVCEIAALVTHQLGIWSFSSEQTLSQSSDEDLTLARYRAFNDVLSNLQAEHGEPSLNDADKSLTGLCFSQLVDFGDGTPRLLVAYHDKEGKPFTECGREITEHYIVEVWDFDEAGRQAKMCVQTAASVPVSALDSLVSVSTGEDGKRYLYAYHNLDTASESVFYGVADDGSFGQLCSIESSYDGATEAYSVNGQSVDEEAFNQEGEKYCHQNAVETWYLVEGSGASALAGDASTHGASETCATVSDTTDAIEQLLAAEENSAARQQAYQLFAEKISEEQTTYGAASKGGSLEGTEFLEGLGVVRLVDFDSDGIEELVLAHKTAGSYEDSDNLAFAIEVWGFDEDSGALYSIYEGAMQWPDRTFTLFNIDSTPYMRVSVSQGDADSNASKMTYIGLIDGQIGTKTYGYDPMGTYTIDGVESTRDVLRSSESQFGYDVAINDNDNSTEIVYVLANRNEGKLESPYVLLDDAVARTEQEVSWIEQGAQGAGFPSDVIGLPVQSAGDVSDDAKAQQADYFQGKMTYSTDAGVMFAIEVSGNEVEITQSNSTCSAEITYKAKIASISEHEYYENAYVLELTDIDQTLAISDFSDVSGALLVPKNYQADEAIWGYVVRGASNSEAYYEPGSYCLYSAQLALRAKSTSNYFGGFDIGADSASSIDWVDPTSGDYRPGKAGSIYGQGSDATEYWNSHNRTGKDYEYQPEVYSAIVESSQVTIELA